MSAYLDTVTPRKTGCQRTNRFSVIHRFSLLPIKEMKKNDWKGPKFGIRYWRISVTFESGIAGFNCNTIEETSW